ncbi:MAG: hypothetical protein ACK44D_08220 [Bacteroidia bacterium]
MNPKSTSYDPTLAVRENSAFLLEEGLIKLSLSQTNLELPDYLGVISLYYDAANQLGLNPDEFLLSVQGKLETPKFVEILNNFLGRPSDEKTIQAWGYDKIYIPEFTYKQM